jgi:hypothetical protein
MFAYQNQGHFNDFYEGVDSVDSYDAGGSFGKFVSQPKTSKNFKKIVSYEVLAVKTTNSTARNSILVSQ